MKKIVLLLLAVIYLCACDDAPTYVDDEITSSANVVIPPSSSSHAGLIQPPPPESSPSEPVSSTEVIRTSDVSHAIWSRDDPEPFEATVASICRSVVKEYATKYDISVVLLETYHKVMSSDTNSKAYKSFCSDVKEHLLTLGFVEKMANFCMSRSSMSCGN